MSHKQTTAPDFEVAIIGAGFGGLGMGIHIRFNSEVTTLQFDEPTGCWQVQTKDGRFITARHVVAAIGPLNRPRIPTIPGLETFQGNERVKKAGTAIALRHLARQIANPVLRQALTPDYEFGCKRILVSAPDTPGASGRL
jgi:cation diffusion facilitator CzcD-associated flavoprotein CzcO